MIDSVERKRKTRRLHEIGVQSAFHVGEDTSSRSRIIISLPLCTA